MGTSACPIGPVGTSFAKQMQLARRVQGFSLRRLSEELASVGWPIANPALHGIEHGSRRITLDDAVAIASVLKMSLPPEVASLFGPCGTCKGNPPAGFACTACGAVGEQS